MEEASSDGSRRAMIRGSLLSSALWVTGLDRIRWPAFPSAVHDGSPSGDDLLGTVGFCDEGDAPMDRILGTELDGRLFTDLSVVNPGDATVPLDSFYIRTCASKLLETPRVWAVQLADLAGNSSSIPMERLNRSSRPLGTYLMECAGNSRSAHFGMLGAANWDGVLLEEILNPLQLKRSDRLLIAGFDWYTTESRTSIPGASWIFTVDELLTAHAFLATAMDGQPLSLDHGAPVRLFVPGWYGCTCIKWVERIALVPDDTPATSQMKEYAGRTMQSGIPLLAREFRPALIDPAAMPVRVEKERIGGKPRFRVAGLQWGGPRLPDRVEIQFNQDEPYVPVASFRAGPNGSWNFWSHQWFPARPGKYTIRLRLTMPGIVMKRLDSGYYARSIEITEI
jgi:DMSO/TMAO reductase YedYZ molybdopterin-dependent catalytic subunit